MSRWDNGEKDRSIELAMRAPKVGMQLRKTKHHWSLSENDGGPINCRTLDHVESILESRERGEFPS